MHIIEFSPPIMGISGTFNTFRLGIRYSKILKVNDTVCLIDKQKLAIMGYAQVKEVLVGRLDDMAKLHASKNHNQVLNEPMFAPDLLIEAMMKRYGPHMVSLDKKVTVIYLSVTS